MNPRRSEALTTLAGLSGTIGFWLVVSPYVLHYQSARLQQNQIISGLFVMLLAALNYFEPENRSISGLLVIIGVWQAAYLLFVRRFILISYGNDLLFGFSLVLISICATLITRRDS